MKAPNLQKELRHFIVRNNRYICPLPHWNSFIPTSYANAFQICSCDQMFKLFGLVKVNMSLCKIKAKGFEIWVNFLESLEVLEKKLIWFL